MLKSCVAALLTFVVAGCASTHPGTVAESRSKDVEISVERNDELSDKHYIFMEYTIENKTPEWREVQIVNVAFEGQPSEILTDDKLEAWIEGAELKLKAAQYNQQVLLGSMAAVGGIAAVSSRDAGTQSVGLATMAGAGAVSAGSAVAKAQGKANSGVKGVNGTVNVPKTHVFVPSKVAPDSYIRRWIVMRAPPAPPMPKAGFNRVQTKTKLNSKVLIGGKPVEYSAEVYTTRF